jgi:putative FmdB family regulatory protein
MPLYEYVCRKCGHRFEVIQKFSDAPIDTCPECGGEVEKIQSAPAFQFKGTGWYITDYAKKDSVPPGETQPGSKSEPKPENKSENKSDTKTETKTEKPAPKSTAEKP